MKDDKDWLKKVTLTKMLRKQKIYIFFTGTLQKSYVSYTRE
jgi:hypothetical protein